MGQQGHRLLAHFMRCTAAQHPSPTSPQLQLKAPRWPSTQLGSSLFWGQQARPDRRDWAATCTPRSQQPEARPLGHDDPARRSKYATEHRASCPSQTCRPPSCSPLLLPFLVVLGRGASGPGFLPISHCTLARHALVSSIPTGILPSLQGAEIAK